ncbi:class I SAM-dependent methyltransferase [Stenotrophomonas sp. W1S232]|uniref:Class I SAM-dependent methyltransferase n=1 Tax=Stenotrophomonas koreensis TaxID=266128 RepID=A0A7W3V1J0_9GAMM|nr:class I SAM-dependent methyltransferase [Stenotrophomonas koreensis]MBB1117749.1 class I SAM-dependent methyltransferase [Stenotrophomonas koreensis]
MADLQRRPHATLDIESRRPKAAKICRLLGMERNGTPLRVLEVGCGSGVISQLIADWLGSESRVDAVDVVDQRVASEGFYFQKVEGVELPYEDNSFDYVISNHVIEHVGDYRTQSDHIGELRRVLSPTGTGYLAVPSRWQLVEPHYRLAFLSWLPHSLRTPFLQLSGRGNHYDCQPLSMQQVEALFVANELKFGNQFYTALHSLVHTESSRSLLPKLASLLPQRFLYPLRILSPTHIYLFGKSPQWSKNA